MTYFEWVRTIKPWDHEALTQEQREVLAFKAGRASMKAEVLALEKPWRVDGIDATDIKAIEP